MVFVLVHLPIYLTQQLATSFLYTTIDVWFVVNFHFFRKNKRWDNILSLNFTVEHFFSFRDIELQNVRMLSLDAKNVFFRIPHKRIHNEKLALTCITLIHINTNSFWSNSNKFGKKLTKLKISFALICFLLYFVI